MKPYGLLALVLSGCASGSPTTEEGAAMEYRRQAARIEAIEEFEARKVECARSGGVLQIRRSSRSRQPPTVREMKMARCSRSGFGGPF